MLNKNNFRAKGAGTVTADEALPETPAPHADSAYLSLAIPLSIYLLANGLKKHGKIAQEYGPQHPCGRPQ